MFGHLDLTRQSHLDGKSRRGVIFFQRRSKDIPYYSLVTDESRLSPPASADRTESNETLFETRHI